MNNKKSVFALSGLAVCVGGVAAAPQVEELGWVLEREIAFDDPISALINPADGQIYVGHRTQDIYVIDAEGVSTKVEDTDDVAGLCVDPRTGDLFLSEDFPGNIKRIPFGSDLAQTWVSGFDSGDDDPIGIAFVPEGYPGTLLTPGGMVSTDRGFGSAAEVWSWGTVSGEEEVELFDSHPTMDDPVDIAVRGDGLTLVADTTTGLVELLDDGMAIPFEVSPPLETAVAVDFDGRSGDALVYDDIAGTIVRVDTATGAASAVLTGINGTGTNWGSLNVHEGPAVQRMVVGSTSEDTIWVFVRIPGCSAADLAVPIGTLDLADINAFALNFSSGNPLVDYDENGIFDLSDVTAYIGAFLAGCP